MAAMTSTSGEETEWGWDLFEQAMNAYGSAMFAAGRLDLYDDLGSLPVTSGERKAMSLRIADAKQGLWDALNAAQDAASQEPKP